MSEMSQPLLPHLLEKEETSSLPLRKILISFVSGKRKKVFGLKRESVILSQMMSCKTFEELQTKHPNALRYLLGDDVINTDSFKKHKTSTAIYAHHLSVLRNGLHKKI